MIFLNHFKLLILPPLFCRSLFMCSTSKIIYLLIIPLLFVGCSFFGSDKGEVLGSYSKNKWYVEQPYGMVLVPEGSFTMGKEDENIFEGLKKSRRTVTLASFFMDDAETSNAEYRQFVNWTRDSIVRHKLGMLASEMAMIPENEEKIEDGEGIFAYVFRDVDTTDITPYQRYMLENYGTMSGLDDTDEVHAINWDADLIWNRSEYPDKEYAEVMDSMYLPLVDTFDTEPMIDTKKLKYVYYWLDVERAARSKGTKRRSAFLEKEEQLVYPDTTVWIRDFRFAYNDPIHNSYFTHQSYQDYPVVGVSWKQAKAFCHWKTMKKNSYLKSRRIGFRVPNFRLPTEAEWEYAARGGLDHATYPWGGPYTTSDQGCFLANFKPMRGNYAVDGNFYTAKCYSYNPNGYGIYNMAGNVSEWTESTYNETSNHLVSAINPSFNISKSKKKVVRGGSWKDVAYYLQVSTRDYEYQDTVKSYIGFRTVQSYLGE